MTTAESIDLFSYLTYVHVCMYVWVECLVQVVTDPGCE